MLMKVKRADQEKHAEQADHHPSITIEWGKVEVCWWSHDVKGLDLRDFVMAAKSDQLYNNQ